MFSLPFVPISFMLHHPSLSFFSFRSDELTECWHSYVMFQDRAQKKAFFKLSLPVNLRVSLEKSVTGWKDSAPHPPESTVQISNTHINSNLESNGDSRSCFCIKQLIIFISEQKRDACVGSPVIRAIMYATSLWKLRLLSSCFLIVLPQHWQDKETKTEGKKRFF